MLGLVVDAAELVADLSLEVVRPLPLLSRPAQPFLSAVAPHGSDLLLLVSVEALLSAEERDALVESPRLEPIRAARAGA